MNVSNVRKVLKDKEIEYVDLIFTDTRGKLQHLTMDLNVVDDDMLENGVFFWNHWSVNSRLRSGYFFSFSDV